MREMVRLWALEHRISPYKLALRVGVSTSQTHKVLDRRWSPSPKLLIRIVQSLPGPWIAEFERDSDMALPSSVHISQVVNAIPGQAAIQADLLRARSEADIRQVIEAHRLNHHIVDTRVSPHSVTEAVVQHPLLNEILRHNGLMTPFVLPYRDPTDPAGDYAVELCRHPLRHGSSYLSLTYLITRLNLEGRLFNLWSVETLAPFLNARQKTIFDGYRQEFF